MHRSLSACILTLGVLLSAQTAAETTPPNILFAIADDLSFPHMGAYGTEWIQTPAFDRVAREGLLFNRCYTPNAKCAPSRACIVTGRNSWQLEEAANHWCYFPAKYPSYIEILARHGYTTGMTGKGWAPGVALDKNGKRRQLTGKPYAKRKAKPPT
ncbi:MAG: sulfatase-like hydrolase/transferase, partial [Rubripirellula sp.]